MRQEKNKEHGKTAIMFAICFSIVILTSVFTIKTSIDKIRFQNNIDEYEDDAILESPVTKPVPTVDSRNNKPGKSSAASDFAAPLEGNVLTGYSPDVPVYSKTLDQYMTHYGVDIEAPRDTQVKAAAQGTVTKVYDDKCYGMTIEITHPGEIRTVYSNLSTLDMVETGDVVEKGKVISGVGDSAIFESLDTAHLHFEMYKGDEHVDPSSYISL